MHANAASALEEYATPGAKVLDVGCGSGYLTAVPSNLLYLLTKYRFLQGWFNQMVKLLESNISQNFLPWQEKISSKIPKLKNSWTQDNSSSSLAMVEKDTQKKVNP